MPDIPNIEAALANLEATQDKMLAKGVKWKERALLAEEEIRKLRAALKEHAPYKEWCSDPLACHNKGTCPRDPNCGD